MNTHQKFKTIAHHHLDFSYARADGSLDYPHSALMLVQCGDGRWLIEQEFGDEYAHFPDILKSGSDLATDPRFYPTLEDAAHAAFAMIREVYPMTPEKVLADFLAD